MKSDYEIYRETGILGDYIPERVLGLQGEDKITHIYRDTVYQETENGMELRREMIVGERKFFIRSIFPSYGVRFIAVNDSVDSLYESTNDYALPEYHERVLCQGLQQEGPLWWSDSRLRQAPEFPPAPAMGI